MDLYIKYIWTFTQNIYGPLHNIYMDLYRKSIWTFTQNRPVICGVLHSTQELNALE